MAESKTSTMRDIVILLMLVAGGILFYRMVSHMETMTVVMTDMAKDVSSMSQDMSTMRKSMQSMDTSIGKFSGGVGQGVQKMEQFNPMQMMK